MRTPLCLLFAASAALTAFAQNPPNDVPLALHPRVFITDSKSWEMSGGGGGTADAFGTASRGGARPQTAEIIKTFGERCPDVTINNKQEKADYVVLLDHEGGKGIILHDNKVAVFNGDGDSIMSHSTRSLGNAVKDACDAIMKDWPARRAQMANEKAGLIKNLPGENLGVHAELEIVSTPPGADIEIDGNFVGSTPSYVNVASGQRQVAVKKIGFEPWARTVTVSGGRIKLDAQLAPSN
jgi:PEGA domain-containing protein